MSSKNISVLLFKSCIFPKDKIYITMNRKNTDLWKYLKNGEPEEFPYFHRIITPALYFSYICISETLLFPH